MLPKKGRCSVVTRGPGWLHTVMFMACILCLFVQKLGVFKGQVPSTLLLNSLGVCYSSSLDSLLQFSLYANPTLDVTKTVL